MPATYTLDMKIEALNLLDQHDGDFRLVTSRLGVPVKTLRGWLADQDKHRRRFEDRLCRRFANIKLELLKDIYETSRDIMKKIRSGDHGRRRRQPARLHAVNPAQSRQTIGGSTLKTRRRTPKRKLNNPTASDMSTPMTCRISNPGQLKSRISPARFQGLV